MSIAEMTDLQPFLRTVRWPALPKDQPTFFTIAGIDRRERPLSNAYAFFFRTEEPHGLGTLFTEALFDVYYLKVDYLKRPLSAVRPSLLGGVRAAREYPMNKSQLLDLILHDGPSDRSLHDITFAVLIENKIDHDLNNDLENYWESITFDSCKIGIVLGPYPQTISAPWVYITHLELALAIEQRLGPVINRVDPRYLPVLLHLLENLKRMGNNDYDAFTQAFNFAQRNRRHLAQAQQVIASISAEGLAAAVSEAYGADYQKRGVFYDRVDIQHVTDNDFRYVVFYSDILNLSQSPTYTISLYAGWAEMPQIVAWRAYLKSLSEVSTAKIDYLPWFKYKELLVGKVYDFQGSTVEHLKAEICYSLQNDWKPLEAKWLTLRDVPQQPI